MAALVAPAFSALEKTAEATVEPLQRNELSA